MKIVMAGRACTGDNSRVAVDGAQPGRITKGIGMTRIALRPRCGDMGRRLALGTFRQTVGRTVMASRVAASTRRHRGVCMIQSAQP